MTLAVVLFVSIFCPSAHTPLAVPRPSAEQQTATDKPGSAPGTQNSGSPAQSSSSPTKATSSPQTQAPPAKKPVTARPRRRKKAAASNCIPAPAATTAAPPVAAAPDDPAQDPSRAVTSNSPPASAPTVCPPPKTIVLQGGTSEPSIQLAGGAVGDQAAQQRHTANQMLGATETNLKKIAGTQLTASQQDMVNQIHQFMDQSKIASSAGDLERARTLAWKAQLLSEELINPQK
jgi:hypothetical protein